MEVIQQLLGDAQLWNGDEHAGVRGQLSEGSCLCLPKEGSASHSVTAHTDTLELD